MEESSFLTPMKALRAAKLDAGMRVADFGAGSGFFARAAARLVGPQGVVWAVDMSGDLLARLKNLASAEGLENIEVVRGDIERPSGSNLPAGQFDFVVLANVLFGAEDRLALAREAARVLRRGGRALVVDWRDSWGGMGPHPEHVVTIGAARDIFEKAGLDYVEDVPAGEYHWGLIVRKK